MNVECPECGHTLAPAAGQARCDDCNLSFQAQPQCPDCQLPLQVLSACGALDYFCDHGDGLISKKRVVWQLTPMGATGPDAG